MNDRSCDVLTRRASLMALGAGITALARPVATDARKRNRKKRDVNKLCKKQVDPCVSFWLEECGINGMCKLKMQRCCQVLGTCDTYGFWTCYVEDSA